MKAISQDLFDRLHDYFENRADVKDGDEGRQRPNEEMSLLDDLKQAKPDRSAQLERVLRTVLAALKSDSPTYPQKSITGDVVTYHLDGQAMYAAINAVRDALDSPIDVQPDWRPIETAPKDGTRVIVFRPKTNEYCRAVGEDYWRNGEWQKSPSGCHPTQWQPMPIYAAKAQA